MDIAEKTLPILVLFSLGLALKHFKLLRKEDSTVIAQIIWVIARPAAIISALASATLSLHLLLLPASALVVDTLLLGLAFLVVPMLGLPENAWPSALMSFPTLELGSIGYALMLAFYGKNGLTAISLFDAGNAFFFFTVVCSLGSFFSPAHVLRASVLFRDLAKNLWPFAAGIALNLFHLHFVILASTLSTLSGSLLFLILLLLAIEFDLEALTSFSHVRLSGLTMYVKLGLSVSIGIIVSLAFHFSGIERIAVVLASTMPCSLLTIVLARKYGLDAKYLATTLALALPLAIVSGAILLALPQ